MSFVNRQVIAASISAAEWLAAWNIQGCCPHVAALELVSLPRLPPCTPFILAWLHLDLLQPEVGLGNATCGPSSHSWGGHPLTLSSAGSRSSSLLLGTRPSTCLPWLASSQAKAAPGISPILQFPSVLYFCIPALQSFPLGMAHSQEHGTSSTLEPALLKLVHHSHRPPQLGNPRSWPQPPPQKLNTPLHSSRPHASWDSARALPSPPPPASKSLWFFSPRCCEAQSQWGSPSHPETRHGPNEERPGDGQVGNDGGLD